MTRIIPVGLDDLDFMEHLRTEVLVAVARGLDIAAEEIKVKLLEPTANWKDKPDMHIDKGNFQREIGTDHDKYTMVAHGTKRHPISAKSGKALRFQKGSPKTRPDNFTAFQGDRSGEVYYAKKVDHPGIWPRDWDAQIEFNYGDYSGGGRLAELVQNEINKIP